MANNFNVFITKIFVLGFCILFVTTGHVFANTQGYNIEQGIEVQGQANVLVAPDSFSLSITIIETGRLTDKIRIVVDNKSNQVIKAAISLGIESKNINSARVNLRVVKNNPTPTVHGLEVYQPLPSNQKSKVFVGTPQVEQTNLRPQYFELSRNIMVNFSNIKDYDQFLNKVIKIGVKQISPLIMSVTDTDKYYQQALTQAVSNAKVKAQKLANQAEQSLGKLLFIKELSRNHYRARSNAMMMSTTSAVGHNLQVGNQAISASVLVKYAID